MTREQCGIYAHVRLRARHDDYYKRVPEGHLNCPGRESRSRVSSHARSYILYLHVSKTLYYVGGLFFATIHHNIHVHI